MVLIAVVLGLVVSIYQPYPRIKNAQSIEFEIASGQSLNEIASQLRDRRLISSRYLFEFYVRLTGSSRSLQAGRYIVSQPVSISRLVYVFSHGLAESDDIIVTIPEGVNIADIDKIFAKAGLTKIGDFLKPDTVKLEGYLWPDTYRFAKSEIRNQKSETNSDNQISKSKTEKIIEKMRENFNQKTLKIFKDLSTSKIKEAVIIASILEKEVKTEEDMSLVAGIIEKRLKLGMPLELDASVAYGVCYHQFLAGKYCDVSLANIVDNIAVDSVYNTYKRKGLPAGPVSNPGLRAIKAVLNPQPSDYLYYLSTKDGTTIFSKTAAEHLRARRKYLSR